MPLFLYVLHCMYAQSCPALWDFVDCSLPGSSVHGIFQPRILEWVVPFYSRESPQPRNQMRVSCIGTRVLFKTDVLCYLSIKVNIFPWRSPVHAYGGKMMEHLVIYSEVYIYLPQKPNIRGYEFLCMFSKRKLYIHLDAQTLSHIA